MGSSACRWFCRNIVRKHYLLSLFCGKLCNIIRRLTHSSVSSRVYYTYSSDAQLEPMLSLHFSFDLFLVERRKGIRNLLFLVVKTKN